MLTALISVLSLFILIIGSHCTIAFIVNAFGNSRRLYRTSYVNIRHHHYHYYNHHQVHISIKSKDEIENDKEMIKIKTAEAENNREVLRLKARELELQAVKQEQDLQIAIQKLDIDLKAMNQSKVIEEQRMKARYLLSITFFLLFYLFGVQLRDGLLGRVTTFNSLVNEFKTGILKRLTSLNIIVGLLFGKEFLHNIFMKVHTWLRKVIRI